MALSPSIPTSFVPKQPISSGPRRRYSAGDSIFLIVSMVIAGIAILAAIGTFLYANYLTGVEKTKMSQLAQAQAQISPDTVEQFVRLRNRLSASANLINQHVELTQFFTLLEGITLQNIRFDSLKVIVAEDRSASMAMAGQAKTFNALAAESTAFAAEKNVKSAIFSGIKVNVDKTVSFTLNATLNPALIVESTAPTSPVILPAAPAGGAPSFSPNTNTKATTTTASTTP
ncbi:hypothetical protein H0X32_00765 [Patescibacteria group bacterium]|nr:hypothetical protein [Patescibacteria group bacterium]